MVPGATATVEMFGLMFSHRSFGVAVYALPKVAITCFFLACEWARGAYRHDPGGNSRNFRLVVVQARADAQLLGEAVTSLNLRLSVFLKSELNSLPLDGLLP